MDSWNWYLLPPCQCFQLLNVQKNIMEQFEEFRSALWLQFCKQRRLVWIQQACFIELIPVGTDVLRESLITSPRRVVRLRMEETAFRCGGWLTANKGWSSNSGGLREENLFTVHNRYVTKCYTEPSWTGIDYLEGPGNGKWTWDLESDMSGVCRPDALQTVTCQNLLATGCCSENDLLLVIQGTCSWRTRGRIATFP